MTELSSAGGGDPRKLAAQIAQLIEQLGAADGDGDHAVVLDALAHVTHALSTVSRNLADRVDQMVEDASATERAAQWIDGVESLFQVAATDLEQAALIVHASSPRPRL